MQIKKEKNAQLRIEFRSCRLCPYRTKSLFAFIGHLRLHRLRTPEDSFECHSNPPQNYKCNKCNFENDLKTALKTHTDTYHANKESSDISKAYKCKGCSLETSSQLVYLRHFSTTANPKCGLFFCSRYQCLYSTSNKGYFKAHSVIHHLSKSLVDRYECEQCPLVANRRFTFIDHTLINHADPEDDVWTRCPQCPFQTYSKKCLEYHISSYHGDGREKEFKWYECDQCSFKSRPLYLMEQHVFGVHNSTSVRCSSCTYKSSNFKLLKAHIYYVHSKPEDVNWFECDQCEYQSKTRSGLKSHVRRRHRSGVWFVCDYCDYKCSYKRELIDHNNRRHLGVVVSESS